MAIEKRSTRSFSDRCVVLCRPADEQLGRLWEETGGFEQAENGPVHVVIGTETTDEKCVALGARFGLEPSVLMNFRELREVKRSVIHRDPEPRS